jgi:hypothetical protein
MTSVLIRDTQRGGEILVKMEADIGGSNHKSRPTDSHQKLEEARNRISPGVSEGKRVLC